VLACDQLQGSLVAANHIQSILAKKDEILEHYSANKNAHCKRARLSQLKNVDEAMYEWYQKARSKNIPVTGPMLQEKAKRATEELGDAAFKASNGWLDRFKKRYNITSKVIVAKQEALAKTL